ncbi:MAG TPA: hypothetical protein VFT42_00495, partial [Solirubrobacteraceae bacterium]|nr:hypothetical protein [Solirubrobacteraceae bacterium]
LNLQAPAYSPDGRWLAVGWPEADSLLFVATAPHDARVRQVAHVTRRFGRGATVTGWCCHS